MKKILTIILIITVSGVRAQNWKEWTQQKKTQIKYLVNQIAALQIYATYVEKGYTITKNGLTAINNIKKGDFSLHGEYFTSLKNVNPKIKLYWKVEDILALQIKIIQGYHQQKNALRQSSQLTPDEIIYCNRVFINLLDGCTHIIDQLILLVTDGNFQMKDDERIKRIDALHAEMKDKYVFAQHFANGANVLSIQRLIDANNVRTGRALMNISQ
ncbi:MAG TPA: hypothetical protein VFI29_01335 [Hanamia sp.]|nr:hypothetical protein [Hanamia sp.]